ncbi:thermonuclease family protein [Aquabacter sp. CN5-332]|uniref:thermonuclease family protein n=1 Tax=Aquabacter sp. CN5-332 TaxID=3156608 RepID=UPI0032B4A594
MRRSKRAITVFVLAALAATGARACPLVRGEPAAAPVRIERGAVRLVDGTRLVPPGAIVPTHLNPSERLAEAAEEAARQLLEGRTLRLASAPADRHGRMTASATLSDAQPVDLAVALVEAGAAYADPARRPSCTDALLSAERRARAERRGLWSTPDAILAARDGAAARARTGLFVVAEGRVYSARRAGDTFYVNFAGPRGETLVASTAAKSSDGLDPAMLTGTLMRVRGVVNGGASPMLAFEPRGAEFSATGRRKESAW